MILGGEKSPLNADDILSSGRYESSWSVLLQAAGRGAKDFAPGDVITATMDKHQFMVSEEYTRLQDWMRTARVWWWIYLDENHTGQTVTLKVKRKRPEEEG